MWRPGRMVGDGNGEHAVPGRNLNIILLIIPSGHVLILNVLFYSLRFFFKPLIQKQQCLFPKEMRMNRKESIPVI